MCVGIGRKVGVFLKTIAILNIHLLNHVETRKAAISGRIVDLNMMKTDVDFKEGA